jgi:hypothetical protein
MKSERQRNRSFTVAAEGAPMHDRGLSGWLLSGFGEDAADAAWTSALALLERAAQRAREGRHGRWAHYPDGDLRRLRRDVAQALWMARTAAVLQSESNDLVSELNKPVRAMVERDRQAQRRAGTVEAERVRLLRAQCRREGREPTPAELHPWIAAERP